MACLPAALAVAVMFLLMQAAMAQQTVATKWPALRFDFAIKRNSMKVYSQSSFSMLASPTVSDNKSKILYDVFTTITEGSTQLNYTLIDGIAYTSTNSNASVRCMDSESGGLPAINPIVAAVSEATAVSSVPDSVTCPSGNVFKVTIAGVDFLLCALDSSGFSLQGSDMDVTVKILESPVELLPPSDVDTECSRVVAPSSVTSIGKSLLTGEPIANDARKLKAALSFSFREKSTCSCKSTPRPCVFVHGLGEKEEFPTNQDEFTKYWGTDLAGGHGPCCSSMKFARLNTVNSTWTSPELQQKVCDRALAASNTSQEAAISDTIVVTHSMGNLMFAGALSTGKCSLDSSSTWVGMAGPMLGSMCSDFVQDSCAGKTNLVLEKVGNITGRCPPNTGLKSLAYSGGSYSTSQMNAAYAAAQKAYRSNVSALMCGKGYSGLTSTYQAQFWGLGAIVPHKSTQNDGMVEFQSCAAGFPETKFGNNYRDQFYATKLNHYDMQFRAGDSLLDEEKMPLKWFDCLL